MAEINSIHQGDCYEFMQTMENESIDMILTDPPYGTINQKWDVKIDVPLMMKEFLRIAKEHAPIVITCQQPFATDLMNAGRKYFIEELIWEKTMALGFLSANKKHLRIHETILIFSKKSATYNPILIPKTKIEYKGGKSKNRSNHYTTTYDNERISSHIFPNSIINYSNGNDANIGHPTEKPEALFEYLIKTYSNEGDTIFEPFAGSFTTAVSALATKRNYICIEKQEDYFKMGEKRIKAWHEFKPFNRKTDKEQIEIFEKDSKK